MWKKKKNVNGNWDGYLELVEFLQSVLRPYEHLHGTLVIEGDKHHLHLIPPLEAVPSPPLHFTENRQQLLDAFLPHVRQEGQRLLPRQRAPDNQKTHDKGAMKIRWSEGLKYMKMHEEECVGHGSRKTCKKKKK